MTDSFVRKILGVLRRPGRNIVILDIQKILSESGSVFDFIDDVQKANAPDDVFELEFLRPKEFDNSEGKKIVLNSDPSTIREHKVKGKRIYIIENTINLKKALLKYVVS